MARLYCRLLIFIAALVFFWPLVSRASTPFKRTGTYLAHRHHPVIRQASFSSTVSASSQHGASHAFVQLQRIELSHAARREIAAYMKKKTDHVANQAVVDTASGGEEQVSLGMNGVPVLDQGGWGSCVTFAVTAGLDAYYALYGSQQISQLCDLALGLSLQTSGSEGGWDGASATDILGQIAQHGFLTLSYQQRHGCGGLTAYPLYADKHSGPMSTRTFAKASPDRRFTDSQWQELGMLVMTDADITRRLAHPELGLNRVKAALRRGHRVSIGIVVDSEVGDIGAVGSYHGFDDVWMLTDDVSDAIDEAPELGGHELLVTGFNDGCIKPVVAGDSQSLCGYLTVRNSWGPHAGDSGNYYVSYDYFNALADEAYEIG